MFANQLVLNFLEVTFLALVLNLGLVGNNFWLGLVCVSEHLIAQSLVARRADEVFTNRVAPPPAYNAVSVELFLAARHLDAIFIIVFVAPTFLILLGGFIGGGGPRIDLGLDLTLA